jgi:hypothetical protein
MKRRWEESFEITAKSQMNVLSCRYIWEGRREREKERGGLPLSVLSHCRGRGAVCIHFLYGSHTHTIFLLKQVVRELERWVVEELKEGQMKSWGNE